MEDQEDVIEMDLEQLAKDIFNEHNYLRKNPQSYIEIYSIQTFRDNLIYLISIYVE